MTAASIGRPRFLTVEEALAQHAIAIRQYGGGEGLRDAAALESAIAMPQQAFGGEQAHAFPFEMAAAYAFHIAKNHPFVDGNKRVALLCCVVFLRLNGWNLTSQGTDAADAILALVGDEIDKRGFAKWLEMNCQRRPSLELRDFFSQVDFESFVQFYEAAHAATQSGERAATIDEAAESIPLLRQFMNAFDAIQKNEPERARQYVQFSMVFVALHRIAEDMGYEW